MKILFITDLISIANDENCAKALVPIIKELQKEHEVDIIRPNFLLNSLIRGKKILKDGIYNCNGLTIQNLNFITPFLTLNQNIDIDKYDKIIAHMPSGILFAERLLSRNKEVKPYVAYAVHQSDIQVLTNFKYSIYFKTELQNAYKNCDEIICRSPHLKQKLLKLLPDCEHKVKINKFKINSNQFLNEEKMLEKFKNIESLSFITAANFIKRKNLDLLIRAFSLHKNKAFTLKIIGTGKEEKSLKKLVDKMSLAQKITFTGKLSQEKVLEEMKKSQIFILPSINETLGLVYFEAMGCGCFCIGTKNTGIDGIFHDNINCFLCEPTVNDISRVLNKTFDLTQQDFENLLRNRKHIDVEFIS